MSDETLRKLEERILRLEKASKELYRQRKGLHIEPTKNKLGQDTYIDGNLYVNDIQSYQYVPLTTRLTSTSWDGDARSSTAKTLIDLSAVFGAPALIKAVDIYVAVRDGGSAGAAGFQGIILAPNDTASIGRRVSCNGVTNDAYVRGNLFVPCDANGDIYYQTEASGANTLDIIMEIWGYWI